MATILEQSDAAVNMYVLFAVGVEWPVFADKYGMAPRDLLLAMEVFSAELLKTKPRDGGPNVRECGFEAALEGGEGFFKTLVTVFYRTVGPRNLWASDALSFTQWTSTITVSEFFALYPNVSSLSPGP